MNVQIVNALNERESNTPHKNEAWVVAANTGQLAARFGAHSSTCPYPITSEEARAWLRAFDEELTVSWRLERLRDGNTSYMWS